MLLIVGGERDGEAQAAVGLLGHDRALLLHARDLSAPGWDQPVDRPADGWLVASGRRIRSEQLTGVLVRRMAVYPQELDHVHADDREYVATELTALLTWWLHSVPVPVVNRPAAGCLCGPGWRPEQWRALAARLGHPVAASTIAVRGADPCPIVRTEVVTIGDAVVDGEAAPRLAERTLALARAADSAVLCAQFGEDDALVNAHCMPRLTPHVLRAIERHVALQA